MDIGVVYDFNIEISVSDFKISTKLFRVHQTTFNISSFLCNHRGHLCGFQMSFGRTITINERNTKKHSDTHRCLGCHRLHFAMRCLCDVREVLALRNTMRSTSRCSRQRCLHSRCSLTFPTSMCVCACVCVRLWCVGVAFFGDCI